MNRFDVIKILSKNSIPINSTAQEILKLVLLIVATCLASKVEVIVREILESDRLSATDIIEEIKCKKEEN
mgnify:CR=1 FL=1